MNELHCPSSFTIDNSSGLLLAYGKLAGKSKPQVVINCSDVRFIRPSGVTLLSCIIDELLRTGVEVRLRTPPQKAVQINKYLYDIGFYSEFKIEDTVQMNPRSTSVNLRRLDNLDYSYIEKLIAWIGRGVTLSKGVKDAIATNLIEIITNATDHSQSPFGFYSCAQWYPKIRRMELCIMDFGVGIFHNLKPLYNHLRTHAQAVKLATREGVSSRTRPGALGQGFSTMKAFVKRNKGALTIISGNGRFSLQGRNETIQTLPASLPGTAVRIDIVNDEIIYYLSGETSF